MGGRDGFEGKTLADVMDHLLGTWFLKMPDDIYGNEFQEC